MKKSILILLVILVSRSYVESQGFRARSYEELMSPFERGTVQRRSYDHLNFMGVSLGSSPISFKGSMIYNGFKCVEEGRNVVVFDGGFFEGYMNCRLVEVINSTFDISYVMVFLPTTQFMVAYRQYGELKRKLADRYIAAPMVRDQPMQNFYQSFYNLPEGCIILNMTKEEEGYMVSAHFYDRINYLDR